MVLIPPDETGDLPLDGYDPDYHCPKYRVITVAMQIAMIKEEKKADGSFLYDEPVLEPQKKAVDMIPTGDLIPPVGSWFDSEDDAKAFVTAVARSCDVSVNVVHMWWTGWSLYQFLNKASEFLYSRSRKKNEDEWRSLSLQERRDKLWRIVIKESPLARDFTPELASHVLLSEYKPASLTAHRPSCFRDLEHNHYFGFSTKLLTHISACVRKPRLERRQEGTERKQRHDQQA